MGKNVKSLLVHREKKLLQDKDEIAKVITKITSKNNDTQKKVFQNKKVMLPSKN